MKTNVSLRKPPAGDALKALKPCARTEAADVLVQRRRAHSQPSEMAARGLQRCSPPARVTRPGGRMFDSNGWADSWRDGIYICSLPFAHSRSFASAAPSQRSRCQRGSRRLGPYRYSTARSKITTSGKSGQSTLAEEKKTDETLKQLAENQVNQHAQAA